MLALGLALLALAQAPAISGPSADAPASALPAFEVVSVKRFRHPAGPWHRAARFDPQRLYIEGMAPVELIDLAYSLNRNQLTGLPSWAQFSRNSLYSITGITDHPSSQAEMLLMLRRVLAERFQLVLSASNKVQPVYFLEVAPGGPKFAPIKTAEDCQKRVDALPFPPGDSAVFARQCNISGVVASLNLLPVRILPLPVIDKTGLTGNYAMILGVRWMDATPMLANGKQSSAAGVRREPVADTLRRELGLDLVKGQAPYRVLNVVHIAPPSPNR